MTDPIITVEQGKLSGKISTDIDGRKHHSFLGIPYAKPPLGDLRFKPPQPAEPWDGIRDATKDGNPCYARQIMSQETGGSEDCLFLNVFTRNVNGLNPVMVWIHGGGFTSGSNNSGMYGADYLMTRNVVLVTINYRLGILGFLQLEDPELGVPGNAGLKDMVMALRWVRRNIGSFGGDPDNVTVFGESAGSVSVHYLMLSPLAKGLFHKGISQSGVALNTFNTKFKELVAKIASLLELSNATERELLEHLTKMPVEKFFEVSERACNMYMKEKDTVSAVATMITIEKPSPDAFLTETPLNITKSGNYNHVPMIFGYNKDEGMLFEVMIRPKKATIPDTFETFVPSALKLTKGSDKSKDVANKIRNFYYGKGSENNLRNFYDLHTDCFFLRDTCFAVQHTAATSTSPIYMYRMSVETKLNILKKMSRLEAPGVTHGDDIGYLFKTRISPSLETGSLEELSVRRFVKYWTNFARTGNPNSLDEPNYPEWKPVEANRINYIDIGKRITACVDPEPERMQFWREIFELNPEYL